MREILFRAKHKVTGEWVYGYFTRESSSFFGTPAVIETHDEDYKVIPETVCQFVNDYDMDGNKIFEYDICECYDRKGNKVTEAPFVITDNRGSFCADTGLGRWRPHGMDCRVIGNAHDNPDMLDGHGKSHFLVTELGEFPQDADDYIKQHNRLTEKYEIHGAHAACYLCNFENDYICHQYNGGCKEIETCRSIHQRESE